ncbi:MAG: DNA primase large subunit PriL [Candidatus Diapherotrites archaeon]|nr:DNA primase large subunit PriL [Candidatus Diapherotrites archaeon]
MSQAAKYPFSSKTKEIVRWLRFDLSNLDPSVLERAKQRAVTGINSGAVSPETSSRNQKFLLTEILSYPVAKILVGLTKDRVLMKRYARAEARSVKKFLYNEPADFVQSLAVDVGVGLDGNTVSFVEYANAAPSSEEYKLVNMPLVAGRVALRGDALVEVVSETLRNQILNDLERRVEVPDIYSTFASEMRAEVSKEVSPAAVPLGPVESGAFPPCIQALISEARSGQPMAHTPRFVLATFLANTGMSTDEIVDVYRNTPNFDEKKTKYYVEYNLGKRGSNVKYTPPACEKMVFYGLCGGKDALCQRIKHPLSYYKARKGVRV